MKWFKHDSNALHDAKIEKLIMRYGIAGYGLYFACVEIIAGNLTPQNITFELEHDSEVLAHKFQMDTLKVEEIMRYCVELRLFELSGTNRVQCAKLAKRLDVTMSNNPEVRRIVTNSNFQKLLENNSFYHQIRLDEIRLDENKILSSTPVSTPSEPKQEEAAPKKRRTKTPVDPRVKVLIDYYHDKYLEKSSGEKPTVTGQWGRTFQILLRAHPVETVKAVVDYFFAYSKRTQFGFNKFAQAFDNLLPAASGHPVKTASVYRRAVCPHCGRALDEGHAPDCPTKQREEKP